ncbi:T9SS type A sorting domain-containing protein [Bacteroidota bacterium]
MKKLIFCLFIFFTINLYCNDNNLVWWKAKDKIFYRELIFDDTRDLLYTFKSDKTFETWDYKEGELINSYENFPFKPSSPDISSNGKYIISPGGFNEFVDIYEIENNKYTRRVLYDTNADAEDVKFLPNDSKFSTILDDGHTIQVFDAEDSLYSETYVYNDTTTGNNAGPAWITHFSNNGRYYFYCRRDYSWVLYDLVTRDSVYTGKFKFEPSIGGVTNDGKTILLRLWDSDLDYDLFSIEDQKTIKETKIGDVYHSAFLTPDEKNMLVQVNQYYSSIDIVSLENPENIISTDMNFTLVFSFSNKNLFAATTKDAKICIVDMNTGKVISEFSTIEGNAHRTSVVTTRFTKDGKYLVSGDVRGLIKIWETETGNIYKTIDETNGSIENINISNDNRRMIASTSQYELLTFDIQEDFKLIQIIENLQPSIIWDICFPAIYNEDNANDFFAVSYDGKVFKMENDSLLIIDTTGVHYTSLDISPDGKQMAIGSRDKFVRVYNLSEDSLTFFKEWIAENSTNEYSPGIRDVFYSPDGEYLISLSSDDRIVKIWETESYSLLKEIGIKREQGSFKCGLFYDGSQRLITTGVDNILKFWDVDSSKAIFKIDTMRNWQEIFSKGITEMTNSIDFYSDGKLLSVGDGYGNVIIFKVTDTLFTEVRKRIKLTNEITISPNPATDYIHINPSSIEPISNIEIYSALGVKMIEAINSDKIDVSGLPSGIYFLKYKSQFYKFIKL